MMVENRKLEGLVETSVVALFFFQKLGKATLDQVFESMQNIGADVSRPLLEQAVDALQARGILSYARGKTESGESTKMWKTRKLIWSNPPEIAHCSDLLPNLVSTKEAQELISTLNADEREGAGESKSKRDLGYTKYYRVRVDFITLDQFLGSQPTSPWLEKTVKNSPYNGVEADLRFNRDPVTGEILIPSDVISGWLRTGLRFKGFSDSVIQYIGIDSARIKPKTPLKQMVYPVIDRGRGAGLNTYECLSPGEKLSISFLVPERGFMGPEDFKRFLMFYAPVPMRGLSPARGKKCGKMAVVGFELFGYANDDEAMLKAVSSGLPEEAKAFYQAELSKS